MAGRSEESDERTVGTTVVISLDQVPDLHPIMDNNGDSWTPTTTHEPLIEAFTITFITTATTAATTPTPPSAAVAEVITTTTTTTSMAPTSQSIDSSPPLHPLEQQPLTNTHSHLQAFPSLPMPPPQAKHLSSFTPTTCSSPSLSPTLQITIENATHPLVNNGNTTTTTLDTSGTPASNTSFTTSNNNSSTLYTNNNTNTASNTVTDNYTEPKTNPTNNNNNTINSSSNSSSNVSRHASSPSSSTTASDKSTKNVSPSVRKISTMTSGGKTLGFLGSLSPKSSKYKISNKKSTALLDSSRPPSPAPPSPHTNTTPPTTTPLATPLLPSHSPITLTFAQPEEASTPTSQRLQSAVSFNMASPSRKLSMDQPDSSWPGQQFHQQLQQHEPQQESSDSAKDKYDKKRAKDKDRHHSHFGQRLSKAIGLSSSSSKNQHQQRIRQLSVDSLSTVDAAPYPTSGTTSATDDSPQMQQSQPPQAQRQTGKLAQGKEKEEKEKEKEKKGGIMNHFLHRPRILSPNDRIKPKESIQSSAGDATGVGGSMAALGESQINSFKFPDAPFAQSATNSDISLDSESHRRDGANGSGSVGGEDNDMATLRRFQSRHRQDRGSSSSGRFLADNLTAQSFRRRPSLIVDLMPPPSMRQHRQQHPLPPSIADMVESAQELHPHHQPGDMERLNLYNHLGLQEIHYSTGTGEEPSELMIRQLYGCGSSPRKSHSSTFLLPGHVGSSSDTNSMGVSEHHGLRRASSPGTNLSQLNASITSNSSTLGAMATSSITPSKSTSSRLGKLGRFKFPSLSIASIHRHKQSSLNGSSSSIQSSSDEQHHAMMLANFNNKRRSSLSIPFKSSMFESSVTVPPPSPASHIHVSDSASTFASVNTVGMTTLGPSTVGSSSNHSSISSSYHALDTAAAGGSMVDSKKPRQSLAAFLEEQAHHPHHSSTSGLNNLPSTTSVALPSQQQQIHRPVLSSNDEAAGNQQQQEQLQQKQAHRHQRQQSRSLGKSFTGSEKFTANTASATGSISGSSGSGSSTSSQHHHGLSLGFRSGFLRRSSRRTVSASHISSRNIFAQDSAAASHQEAATLAYQDLMEPQVREGSEGGGKGDGVEVEAPPRQFKSDRDILSAALLHDLAVADNQETHGGRDSSDGGEGTGDLGPDDLPSVESNGSVVGQYLFGDELKNLSFGGDSTLVKVDSAVDTTGAAIFETESGLKTVPANAVSGEALAVAPGTIPTTLAASPASATMTAADPDKALLSKLLSGKKKSGSFLLSARDSTLSTQTLPTSTTTPNVVSTSPTHLYTTDSKPTSGSIMIPRDRKLTLGSKIIHNTKQQETSTTLTPPTFIPRSPAVVAAYRKFPGSPGCSPSLPSSYSTHPPILSPQVATAGTPTKAKFSILGTSANPSSGFSYLQSRPSLSLSMASSASSSKNNGVGPSSISPLAPSAPYMPHHSSSTPLPGKSSNSHGNSGSPTPHLEPRSAVVDYRPAIHYKRQRSMSLQDADLLTADQFIALMPDDATTKRRFSSEETVSCPFGLT